MNNCGRYIRSVLQKGSPTDVVQTAVKEHELFTRVRDQSRDIALDPGAIQFSFDMRMSGNLEQV